MRFRSIASRALLLFVPLLVASPASGSILAYDAILSGPGEAPPNASPGTGFGLIVIDNILNTMTVDISFTGLTGTTTASHIHCCIDPPGATGVATTTPTFAGFPLGVSSGTYHAVLDLTNASSWNPAYISANGGTPLTAEAALLAGIAAGQAYLNIHSAPTFGGGEIRGFLAPVPEPSTFAMAGLLVAAGIAARRYRGARN